MSPSEKEDRNLTLIVGFVVISFILLAIALFAGGAQAVSWSCDMNGCTIMEGYIDGSQSNCVPAGFKTWVCYPIEEIIVQAETRQVSEVPEFGLWGLAILLGTLVFIWRKKK